jgi:tRNA(Ile)-lysidine synthase
MNADLAFARPRLRAAAPALVREGLTPQRVARLAERIARYEQVVAAATRSAREALLDPQQPGRLAGHALLAVPEELALRLIAEEIVAMSDADRCRGGSSVRLQRLEALWSEMRRAIAAGRALRRTLAGALVSVSADGAVLVSRAPPRRADQAAPPRGNRAKHPFTKRR